jgi:hypothetical protein
VLKRQADFEQPETNSVATISESAVEFGLTPSEVLGAIMATPDRLPQEMKLRYLDELSGALAKRLLAKQRQA